MSTSQAQPTEHVQPVPDSSVPPIGIHMTREELRAKSLHELAEIFSDAFEMRQ